MAAPIKGTQGPNTLLGTDGADKLMGKDGDDIITGGKGNDDIDGGNGIDTAVYSGSYAEYSLNLGWHLTGHGADNSTVSVATRRRPRRHSHLKHVEFLKFADAIFDVQSDVTHRWDASIGGNEIQGAGQPHPVVGRRRQFPAPLQHR